MDCHALSIGVASDMKVLVLTTCDQKQDKLVTIRLLTI
jgi:hypothetical protein